MQEWHRAQVGCISYYNEETYGVRPRTDSSWRGMGSRERVKNTEELRGEGVSEFAAEESAKQGVVSRKRSASPPRNGSAASAAFALGALNLEREVPADWFKGTFRSSGYMHHGDSP